LAEPAAGCFVVGTGFEVLLLGTFFTGAAGVVLVEGLPVLVLFFPDAFAGAGMLPDCCAKEILAKRIRDAVIKLNFFMTFKVKIG
jgi:hypothetical protein